MRGDLRVDQQRQLRDRHAEQRRRHLAAARAARRGMSHAARIDGRRQPDARQAADAAQRRHTAPRAAARRRPSRRRPAHRSARCPSRANRGASQAAAAIIARFSSTGVAAGTAKRLQVFRMPADSATSDMNADVREHPARHQHGVVEGAAAPSRAATPAPARRRPRSRRRRAATRTAPSPPHRSAGAWPRRRRCARVSARIGTKACENAPSANSRRSRFGMRNATLNASVHALAPKAAAISSSRTRPVMREASVSRETVDAARSRFMSGRPRVRRRPDCKDRAL